ncbi:MAG: PKD domain-containing protein, partial [Candidatus Aenigmatarchaeota archaeon]
MRKIMAATVLMVFALALSANPVSASGTDLYDLIVSKNNLYLDGDTNSDYIVNETDLAEIGRIFGTSEIEPEDASVDLNKDDVIDIIDLATTGVNFGSVLFSTASTNNTIQLSVEPSETRVEPGTVFDIDIVIDTDDKVFGGSIIISYEPTFLNATDAYEGDFLGGDGASTYPIIMIDQDKGNVFYDSTRFGTDVGISGTGNLLVITFEALAEGTSPVDIEDTEFVDETFAIISPVYTTNGTVEVNVNDAPVIAPIPNKNVDEATTISFDVTVTDADGDDPVLSVDSGPGSMTGNTYSYTPDWDPNHDDEVYGVTILADDGYGGTDTEFFQLTVNDVNRDPTIGNINNKNVDEGQTLSFTVSGSDPENDELSYTVISGPGSMTGDTYSYSPGWDTNHADEVHTVEIEATDGYGGTDTETFQVTVNDVNRPPNIDSFTPTDTTPSVDEGSSLSFSVTASDPDGDTLSYTWKLDGANVGTGNSYTYSPGFADSGTHTVSVTVSDGNGGTDTQSWTVTVNNVNRPPTIDSFTPTDTTPSVDEGSSLSFSVTASDPDGDTLSYTWKLD